MGPDVGVVQRCGQQTPTPARISLETLMAERAELYAHVLPPGRSIPVEVAPFPVYYNIPGGGGGYCRGGTVAATTSLQRPIRREGQTPQDVDLSGNAGGRPQPTELGEGRHHYTGGLQGRITYDVVCLADGGYDT